MNENFLKYKKIGLISVGVIIVLSSLVIYNITGFNELNKNNNESIFVDDENSIDNNTLDNNTLDNNKDETKINFQETSNTNSNSSIDKIEDKTIIVEIKGEVKKPDVYVLDENSIINDLINLAGGVTENADLSAINRAKKLQNHEMIYISNKNDDNISLKINSNVTSNEGNSGNIVDINTASVEELKKLNGVGDSKAKNIVEYREQNGGFKSIEEIKNVNGIGEKMFEKIKENIIV